MSSGAQARKTPRQPPRLPERYRLRRHIAAGGMASVWCAEDLLLDRTVAVKILAERFADDQLAVRRFKREARAAARVSGHAHVVTVFDVGDAEPPEGQSGQGRAFIVMEYLAGGTVADAIRVGAVRRHEAMRWLSEAAAALDHAHSCGIVHRDIKPANFLLDRNRVLHVTDFGIARLISEDTITSSDELFGTAAYLSPEQALGRPGTSAADRYALAVVAFELLAGERPFTATHFAAQARQHVEDEPPCASERNPTLPAAVDGVLTRGLAKEPADRFATAGELVLALQRALSEIEAPAARPILAADRRPRPRRRPRPPAPPPPSQRRPGRRRGTRRQRRHEPQGARRPGAAASAKTAKTAPSAGGGQSPSPVAWTPGAAPAGAPRRHLGRRAIALAALLVVIAGITAFALGAGGSAPSRRASSGAAHAKRTVASTPPRHRLTATHTATAPAATGAPAPTSSTAAASTAAPTATQLQATGHQQMLDGDYQSAIGTLRQAVQNSDPSSLTYAYALYDLGRSLLLSGDAASAVQVLQQRAKIPNQTAVVQQLLDQALRAAGKAPATPPRPHAPSKTGPKPGTGTPTGGAGLGPPSPERGGVRAKSHAAHRVSGEVSPALVD